MTLRRELFELEEKSCVGEGGGDCMRVWRKRQCSKPPREDYLSRKSWLDRNGGAVRGSERGGRGKGGKGLSFQRPDKRRRTQNSEVKMDREVFL